MFVCISPQLFALNESPSGFLCVCVFGLLAINLKAEQEYPRLYYVSGFPVSMRVPSRDMQEKSVYVCVCVYLFC